MERDLNVKFLGGRKMRRKMKRHQKKKLSYLLAGFVLILGFQNCTQSDYAVVTKKVASVDGELDLTSELPTSETEDTSDTKPPTPPISEEGNINYVNKVATTRVPANVDILVVGDNSGSMKYEQTNMSQKFPSFIENLQSLDWRMGIITTDAAQHKGSLVPWKATNGNCGDQVYLDAKIADASICFSTTIQLGYNGSGDEEGIRSSNLAIQKNHNNWMRADAHLAIVVLSDEDEKSDALSLGTLNQPESVVESVKSKFGNNKSVSFHSIVVNSDSCLEWQRKSDPYTRGGNKGTTYMKASQMMNGLVGSVCHSDYSSQLKSIGSRIQQNIGALNLDCSPVTDDKHSIKVSINNILEPSLKYRVTNTQIFFEDQIEIGADVKVEYVCAERTLAAK